MGKRVAIALAIVAGLLAISTGAIADDHDERCRWVGDPPVWRCEGRDPGSGGPGGPGDPGDDPPRIVWIHEDQGYQDACMDGEHLWWAFQYDTVTGESGVSGNRPDLQFIEYCAPPGTPPPPPPPSTPEVTAALDEVVPLPAFEANPDGIGVTGLETWFWYDTTAQPVTLTGTLDVRSFQIEYELQAIEWIWRPGDGAELTSTEPGSPDDLPASAAATHTYETKAFYDVEMCVVWSGTWSVVGDAPNVVPPRAICSSTPYRVDEIVSRRSG